MPHPSALTYPPASEGVKYTLVGDIAGHLGASAGSFYSIPMSRWSLWHANLFDLVMCRGIMLLVETNVAVTDIHMEQIKAQQSSVLDQVGQYVQALQEGKAGSRVSSDTAHPNLSE